MNSNIYEFNAARVLDQYAASLVGNPNCTLLAIYGEASEVSDQAKDALVRSAERLGFGLQSIAWLCAEGLSAADVLDVTEGMDPVAIICLDTLATKVLSDAYATSIEKDTATSVRGRRTVAFRSFSSLLANPDDKQKAWSLLKRLS